MTELNIAQIDKIWKESIKHQTKRKKLYTCPFPPLVYSSTSGILKREKVECKFGKGVWCGVCSRHTRWQKQAGASNRVYLNRKKKMLLSYDKTGLVPHLRPRPNPSKITDPFGGYIK